MGTYAVIPESTFQDMQLDAGVLLKNFDHANPTIVNADIITATTGGVQATCKPSYSDMGEDVDNVPANTKELKVLESVNVTMSGTAKTADSTAAKLFMASCTETTSSGLTKLVPNADLSDSDFVDLWWVGDYSDKHGATNGGFMAIHVMNALSTGGFQLQSNDKGKGDFEFEFTGHYSISDMTTVPYEIYIKAGSAEPQG